MNAVTCQRILSFQSFTKFLSQDNTQDIVLFRGQRADWPLVPKLARMDAARPVLDAEREMLKAFKQQSLPFLSATPATEWDWLALAQHHGLATRLLDWTLNPLVALWFSVRKPAESGRDGVVWIFRPTEEDFANETEDPFSGDRTKAFRPNHVTNRIRVQSGYFTVHKFVSSAGEFVRFNSIGRYKPQLTKLVMPAKAFPEMRYRLDQFGVNQAVLFPDLDGLCAHAQWLHSFLADEKKLKRDHKDSSWRLA
jgi:hypothetical protein